jgi:hypothetical protein
VQPGVEGVEKLDGSFESNAEVLVPLVAGNLRLVYSEAFNEGAFERRGGHARSATLRQMAAAERKPVDDCASYLLPYSPYLQYDQALAEGVPIATGVIEGACRHLVQDRMNLTGARWSLTGAEAVLRLRALRSSNDFDAYWKFHEQQEYERNHASPLRRPPRAKNRPATDPVIATPPFHHAENRQKERSPVGGLRTHEATLMPKESQI